MSKPAKPETPSDTLNAETMVALAIGASIMRKDGWYNTLTGMGSSADKAMSTRFRARRFMNYEFFTDLFEGDALFHRIAAKEVSEAFRPGYTLELEDSEKILLEAGTIGGLHPNEPGVDKAVQDAQTWANVTGGAIIIMLFEGEVTAELRNPRPPGKRLTGLRVKSAQDAYPSSYTSEASTEFYTVVGDESYQVHKSRVVPFFGEDVSLRHRRQLRGWGASVYLKPFDTVLRFRGALGSVGLLLSDLAQGVFKIKNLFEGAATTKDLKAQKRLAFTDINRSSGKSIFLDSEDDFSRVPTPLGGAADLIRELKSAIAMEVDMPETELYGRSAAGMNATGENDLEKWYQKVHSKRVEKLSPRLVVLFTVIAESLGRKAAGLKVCWNPLSSSDDKKEAETEKVRVESANAAIDGGLLKPLEAQVALAQGRSLFSAVDVPKLEDQLTKARGTDTEGIHIPDDDEPEPKEGADTVAKPELGRALLTSTDNAEIALVGVALEREGLPPYTGEMAQYMTWTVAAFREFQRAKVAADILKMFPAAEPTLPTGVNAAPSTPTKPEAPKVPEKPEVPAPPEGPAKPEAPGAT